MGATIQAYWPGITPQQLASQPGFYNDCAPWGDWSAVREQNPEVIRAIRKLKVDAIRTFTTHGIADDEVDWVTPSELRKAALKLKDHVRSGKSETKIILSTYEEGANLVDSLEDEFVRDLDDIANLASWAEAQGATRMTLEINS